MVELEKNEKIIFEIRKHWFQFALESIAFVLAAVFPGIIAFLAIKATYPEGFATIYNGNPFIIIFFYSLWLLALWMAFFVAWTDYYLDLWIITDKRIIDIEQKGLFRRDVASMRIEDIQDIRIEVHGLFETLLSLGEIEIQTAGSGKEFKITHARHPEEAKKRLMELFNKLRESPQEVRVV